MSNFFCGITTIVARFMIVAIFLMAAVGNKIPHFNDVVNAMTAEGIPYPQIMLVGAIAFLIVGSVSIILGYKARFGAFLIFVFLGLATYYFHDFWKLEGQAQQEQMIQFLKNLSMGGAMLFLMANGAGRASLDRSAASRKETSKLNVA